MSFFESLGLWNWFVIGGILLIAEVLVPGVFLLWLGLAALIVGAISLVVDWPWQLQVIVFAVLSLASVPLWRRLSFGGKTDQPFLNRRTEALIGRIFTLEKPIVGGVGAVAIDDTVWRVTGADTPAGSRIKVTRVDGATIYVERVDG
jgi:membrane protein implicated in regulation of membrane protease activity